MSVRRIIFINILALLVILAAIYAGYNYYYQTTNFVSTTDATIQGEEIPVNVEFPGTLSDWSVKSGDPVTAGETLGKIGTAAALQQAGVLAKNPAVVQSIDQAAEIQSPITGTILRTTAADGQLAAPGQPLAYVVDLSKLYVTANVDETALRHIDVGQTVDISIDAFPDQSFKGTVESIGLAANSVFALIPPSDEASGTYTKVTQTIPVKISLAGYSGINLMPGMNATVHIHRTSE